MGGAHNVDGTTTTYPNNPESFSSGGTDNSDWTLVHVFTIEGNYDYECTPHASMGMVGTITVNSAGEPNDGASDDDCQNYTTADTCPSYCDWDAADMDNDGNIDTDEGSCHKDDGPPECLKDCDGIDTVADTDDGYAICVFLDPLWDDPNSCANDCADDEDHDMLSMMAQLCNDCLAADTDGMACQAWFDDLFDGHDGDCHQYSSTDCV
jgi:hypothetical protein